MKQIILITLFFVFSISYAAETSCAVVQKKAQHVIKKFEKYDICTLHRTIYDNELVTVLLAAKPGHIVYEMHNESNQEVHYGIHISTDRESWTSSQQGNRLTQHGLKEILSSFLPQKDALAVYSIAIQ